MKSLLPPTSHSNLRVFYACLLSFLMLIAPLAPVAAASRDNTPSPAAKDADTKSQLTKEQQMDSFLFLSPPAPPPSAAITATKNDAFPSHPSGQAEPGDEITYTVDVGNTGLVDATGVTFTDTIDPNTTYVTNSLAVSPLALNDTYVATKDTQLSVGTPGVLTNDTGLPAPTAVPIVAGATTGGGTVTLNANGSFIYNPAAGFTGVDTFTYTATNGHAPPLPTDSQATVTINVDAAPTVASTTPTNGALNQPTNTNITITFSEPVNVTGNWFTIACTVSGTRNVADTVVTGGPTTFTINPNTDFTQAESCTVTVDDAAISDQDGNDPPDNMAADYVFSFTMDAAPGVQATTPANGATGASTNSNLTITFTEPVNVSGNWFQIVCATTGTRNVADTVVTGGPTTFTINPNVDFSQNELCTVTVFAAQVADQDTNDPPNNMLANYVFSYTTDAAPSVTATTPTNGATDQTSNTDITITFSEPVNVTGNWFQIICTSSGTRNVADTAVTGGPTTFTVNPNTDFTAGESCTVTVFASQIADQDGNDPPDNMLANHVFTFSIDAAPTVNANTPTNGATQVANNTNITLTFSEPVNVTGNWFTIVCASSGTRNVADTVVTGGPTNFTINPNTDFTNGELCTVTILAAQVTDQDGNDPPDNMAANFVFSFTIDNPPTVTTTVPADDAINVAENANITVNFSEPVNVTTSSFTLECPVGTAKTFTVSGTGTSAITLDPTADLPPGVRCTVTVIANQVTDTDAGDPPDNMTANFVFDFGVKPRAVDDARNATGNIRINTDVTGFTVLTNDIGPGIVVTPIVNGATLRGGNLDVDADGTFRYNPPVGYEGPDSFDYTISNTNGSDIGTVNLTVAGMIWFINNSAAACTTISTAAGCGRLTNPLSTVAAFESENGNNVDLNGADVIDPEAGDHIFIYTGGANYTAPLTLENSQRVIGQGATSSLQTLSGITPAPDSDALPATGGTNPSITSASGNNGLNLAQDNRFYGLTFSNTSGTAVNRSGAIGTLIFGDIVISNTSNTSGSGISLINGGAGNVTSTGINTINTAVGTALLVLNTNIGASNITFRRIDAGNLTGDPDPTNGIQLSSTGTTPGTHGGLVVTGNSAGLCGGQVTPVGGGTPATVTAPNSGDCSGGTIQGTTGFGISLNSTRGVSLTRMWVKSNGDDGIHGTTVTDFSLISSLVESNGQTVNEHGIDMVGLLGNSAITNSTVRTSAENNLYVDNSSGTLTLLDITGSQFSSTTAAAPGADGVLIKPQGTSNMTINVSGSYFSNNRDDQLQMAPTGTATSKITVNNNTFADNTATTLGGGITINPVSNTQTRAIVTNNDMTGSVLSALNFNLGAFSAVTATFHVTATGNFIGNAGVVQSGSETGHGIQVWGNGEGTINAVVSNNNVRNWGSFYGINVAHQDGDGDINLTMKGNTVAEKSVNTLDGVRIEAGAVTGDAGTICADVGDAANASLKNTITTEPNANGDDLRIRIRIDANMTFPGYVGGGTDAAALQAYLTSRNILTTVLATESSSHATPYGNAGAGCTQPLTMYQPEKSFQRDELARINNASQPARQVKSVPAAQTIASSDESLTAHSSNTATKAATQKATTQKVAQPVVLRSNTSETVKTAKAQPATYAQTKRTASPAATSETFTSHAASSKAKARPVAQPQPVAVAQAQPAAQAQTSQSASQPSSGNHNRNSGGFLSAAMMPSGETVNHNIGTLPAGKNVRITFKVTVNTPFTGSNQVSNQATINSTIAGNPFTNVTDDPGTGVANDPTITPVLGPPVAGDDAYTAFKNTPLNITAPGVLANDTNGPTATPIAGGATTAGGTVTLNANGSFTYTPPTGYTGADSFTYTATNATGSDTATVNITVADVSAFYLNEVLFNPPGTDAPNEYIELRGPASTTIPAGTYFVGVEGDNGGNPGDVQTIINLSGLTFGSNGFLVLLQNGNTYTTAAGATVITSTATGFSGLPGAIFSADAGTDIENDSVTFMLVQTGVAPVLTDDIDADNNATPDGTAFAGWSVRDSIGVLNTTANGRGYGAINYHNGASGTSTPGSTVVTVAFTAGYVGRIGDSTGSTAADWVASVPAGLAPNFTLGIAANTEPASFAGKPLNHIGASNFVNLPPVNSVPAATQSINEDTTLTFNAANSNLISISDPDAGTAAVQVTLTATNGTITLNGTAGLSFTVGDGVADATMTFTGTIANINTALNGLTYTPTLNYNGPATLTIETNDQGNVGVGGAKTDTDVINISVTGINDAPTLDPLSNATIAEDAGTQIVNLSGITAGAGESQTLVVTATSSDTTIIPHPTVTYTSPNSTGSISYAPVANANGGPVTITVTVQDNGGVAGGGVDTIQRQFTVTVTEVNDAPVATDDVLSDVAEDSGAANIPFSTLLANDSKGPANENGQTLNITAVSNATGGTAQIVGSDVVFTPTANYSGPAGFDYTVTDNGTTAGSLDAKSDTGTVTFNITAVNDPPSFTKGADQVVNEDAGPQTVTNWATNISQGPSESGQTLTFNVSVTGTTGNIAFSSGPAIDPTTGNLTYTTSPDTNGTATISVTLSDNGSNVLPNSNTSAAQTFTITANAVNDAPTFQIPSNPPSVNEDAGAQAINSFATNFQPGPVTATDEVGQTLVGYTVTQTGTTGNLTFTSGPSINNAGQLTYTPTANTSGTATFNVVATDSGSGTAPNVNQSAPVSFTITVTGQNDAPVIDNTGNMTLNAINEDVANASNPGTLVSDVIASAGGDRITDVDAGAVEGIAVTSVNNTNGTWQYTIDNGTNWIAFGAPDQTTARLLAANATTRVRFIPNPNFNGTVNPGLTFRAWDQTSGTNGGTADVTVGGGTTAFSIDTETASITVNPVNDTPTANAQVVGTAEDTPVGITLTGTDVETASGSLVYNVTVLPTNGTLTGSGANRTYTPNPNYNGPDSFQFTVTDTGDGSSPALTSAPATITINVGAVNDAPTADAQSVTTNEDTPKAITLTGNDIDTPAGSLTYIIVTGPTNGVLSGSGANRTYTPNANYNGPDSFTFKINDGTADSNTATVSITVTPVNDTPTANAQSVTTNEDTPKAITLTGSDIETASGSLTFTVTVQPTNGVLSGSGANRTYTPNANYNGPDSFKFTVTDTGDGSSPALTSPEATVSITVTGVNDAPVNTVPGPQNVSKNDSLTFSAANSNAISIADLDAGTNPVQVTLTATNGRITLSGTAGLSFTVGDGTSDTTMTFTGTITNINNALNGLVYEPTNGYDGPATIQIVTNDQGNSGTGGALSDTDTINITVVQGGILAFNSATYTVAENGGSATITVVRTGSSNGTTKVDYTTSNGTATAGQDYTTASGQLTFNNGVTTQTFTVPITEDALDEANETVNLTLSNVTGSGDLGVPSTAVLTITDNDPQPSLSINDATVTEGNSGTVNAVFTVTLSAVSGQNVTVNYATADGSATAPTDYTAIPSTVLTFLPGETTKTITVAVNGDTTAEPDENFFVNLSGASNATLTDNQGLGTILSDDTPIFQFSSSTYSVNEDGLRMFVTVNRLGDLSKVARVDYLTSDPSGLNNCSQITGNASSRCDYATTAGTLRFGAGETSKVISIPIVNDVYLEGPEVFTITLSNNVNADLGSPTSAVITIIDNDTAPAPNPIDSDEFFIRQLYIDFLGREPDPAGLAAWLAILNHCAVPTDCDRIAVAQGFVRSPEFQDRGYFVYRAFRSSLGRFARYDEFIPDMARLSGFLSAQDLEANKADYILLFMERQEFKTIYDPTIGNPTAYVDTLLQKAELPGHPSRNAWIAGLTNNTLTRAQVLRQLMESSQLYTKYVNEAFIVMNYFGFLRRNPDAAYLVWINIFNTTNDDRLIINGFLSSPEYRLRFGPN